MSFSVSTSTKCAPPCHVHRFSGMFAGHRFPWHSPTHLTHTGCSLFGSTETMIPRHGSRCVVLTSTHFPTSQFARVNLSSSSEESPMAPPRVHKCILGGSLTTEGLKLVREIIGRSSHSPTRATRLGGPASGGAGRAQMAHIEEVSSSGASTHAVFSPRPTGLADCRSPP